jgi:hypothetical protein
MNHLMVALGAAAVTLAGATGAAAQTDARPERPVMEAVRLEAGERLRLDGTLDESAWQRAQPADGFLQQEPRQGAPATERTEVRVLYDRDNLYIGVIAFDSDPAGILGTQLQRDAGLGPDDRFMWVIDTFLDGRSGYFFEINPVGLMGDGLLRGTAGGGVNKSWDGIWEARVARGNYGWSAEIRIPFRTLNFNPASDTWGINFQRTVRRKSEESLWTGNARNQGLSQVANAGRLTGLTGMSQGLGLEARPYFVASADHVPARISGRTESAADVGMDINYSITPGLRASLTLNTDFAEAEVDQRRVNLTRFPLMFPERRDFFLEGSGVYSFAQSSGPSPYFSRRIGLVNGNPVPIRAGARLTGQAGAYELGFLQVRTGATAFVPGEDFTVARVKRPLLRQSSIGAVYTRRHTANDGALLPLPIGATPAPAAVMPQGNTLGVDADFFTSTFRGNRNLQLEAFLVWHDDPFGNATTTFGDRTARGFRLNYPNDLWRMHISTREFGNAYNPHVGFVQRRGFRRTQPTVTYAPRPERWASVRQLEFTWFLEHLTDLDGRLQTFGNTLTLLGARFASGDQFDIKAGHSFERLDNPFRIYREPGTARDVIVPVGDYTTIDWELSGRTASRRRVAGNARILGGQFWSGNRLQLAGGLDVQPRAGLNIGASVERNDVRLAEGDFRTHLFRVGGGWHMSPWMSLTSNVQYDDVSRVVGTFTRFRWIVRPGSDIYLVYTHNLLEDPASLDRFRVQGLGTLERQAATKISYTHRF